MFVGHIPGALGLLLRKIFYPTLFKAVGKGVVFGRSIVVRHPNKIELGDGVVIDDYALLDGRGAGEDGLVIGKDVIINRYATIQAKVGAIQIGANTNIGARTSIIAQGGVIIGEMVTFAGGCTISGGAYKVFRDETSPREHGRFTRGPIMIDNKCRFGMGCMVLDGVHIKEGTILGAMSLVTEDLPEFSVAAGIPAKVKYLRDQVTENKD